MQDIIRFKNQGGEVIVLVDLNTRTSNYKDFIEPDKHDSLDDCPQTLPLRNSFDKAVDGKGREVLEICKSLDLSTINGRKLGDMFGNISFQWNGSSVVDYAITSQSLFQRILTFKKGKYKPWISDYCPLHYCFQIKDYLEITPGNLDLHTPNTWYLDNSSKEKFMLCLQSREISAKIENILNISIPTTLAQETTYTQKLTAIKCGLKTKTNIS